MDKLTPLTEEQKQEIVELLGEVLETAPALRRLEEMIERIATYLAEKETD